MADFPYSTVPNKLSEFLLKIREIGIPDKVTTRWLPTVGFASANDRSIIPVLKHIDLLDQSARPTNNWRDYRGTGAGGTLANCIQSGYKELFQTYPDAHQRSSEELKSFFRGHSSYGAQAVGKAVATFQALCKHADFEHASPGDHKGSSSPEQASQIAAPGSTFLPTSPALHIDIQIHISPEASPEQIEAIFKNMSKYLYKA